MAVMMVTLRNAIYAVVAEQFNCHSEIKHRFDASKAKVGNDVRIPIQSSELQLLAFSNLFFFFLVAFGYNYISMHAKRCCLRNLTSPFHELFNDMQHVHVQAKLNFKISCPSGIFSKFEKTVEL